MTGNCTDKPSKATSTYNHNYNLFSLCSYTLTSFPPYRITITFIFIPWILTGLQKPYGYGHSHIFLRSQEVKSVYECTPILVTGSRTVFEDLT